jgi:hemin uptake protein HemP
MSSTEPPPRRPLPPSPGLDLQPSALRVEQESPEEARAISSAELFGGRRELLILHQGSTYRLIITRQGKLLLNK